MKILSVNINDFGGLENHLMEYKRTNYYGKEVIYWEKWSMIDKSRQEEKFCLYIDEKTPDIIILQEFQPNNSKESYDFINWMNGKGYKLIGEVPDFNISMTVIFISEEISYESIQSPHKRSARSSSIKIGKYIIYGTHVPVEYDKNYWEKLILFYNNWKEEKIILIGDFNTYAEGTDSKKKFNELINRGAVDVWLEKGNPNTTPTEKKYGGRLDYVIVSPEMYKCVCMMNIDSKTMDENMSDHASLILEIE